MFKLTSVLVSLLLLLNIAEAFKVLLICPLPSKSHTILCDGIARNLLAAQHEVTYIKPFTGSLKPQPLLREIDVSFLAKNIEENDFDNISKHMKKDVNFSDMSKIITMFIGLNANILENKNVKELLYDAKENFDVVISEWLVMEVFSAMGAIFDCPFIWYSTIEPHWMVLRLVDDAPNPAYTPDAMSSGMAPFSFSRRVKEISKMALVLVIEYFYLSGEGHKDYEKLIVPILKHRGKSVPSFDEVRYNASLMLGNSHVSLGNPIRLPQNYIPIGGAHIDDDVKPLPEDLKKLLDSSKDGLIFFSMGSNLKSQHMPLELKESLLKMFGRLKQNVLWKFEEELPNRPKNVHIVQWAPQQSILHHPNCVIFITHGGLLSTIEAVHFATPMIGIPVFGDQFNNVERAVKKGFAKRVDLSYTMAENLEEAIHEVLTESRYTEKIKELSLIYHDRVVPPGKELVHWVEHVVKTRGAPHLRSPALQVPWYQKIFLDVLVAFIVIIYAIILTIRKIRKILFTKRSEEDKKKKN